MEKVLTRAATGLPSLGRAEWSFLHDVDPSVIAELAAAYRTASPFPHLVIDDLFDADLLREIERSFEAVPERFWGRSRNRLQKKLGTVTDAELPPAARTYFDNIHSLPMRHFLSQITGIAGLQADPTLQFGGMHEIPDGGSFELHVDFAFHPETLLKNRLVILTYLNEGWLAEFGGALELWHWKPRLHAASVLPAFGRTIILGVGPHNVHGHPHPTHAPDGRPRRSVAAYYYSELEAHEPPLGQESTGYVDRPDARLDQRAIRLLYAALPPSAKAKARKVLGRR